MRDVARIVLLGVVVLFTNLGGPRLWDRDEPRNAGCAAEMMARGDWVVPWFNDELRTHKPVLLYWLIMSAYAVFGIDEFSARFWSAALGIATACLTYGVGRRVFDRRVGSWAAMILLTTLMFDVASRAATPDAPLIFCSALAVAMFVFGEWPSRETAGTESTAGSTTWPCAGTWKWSTALAVYGAAGLGVLAKGPVGAVLPTAVIGMYLLIARLPDLSRRTVGDTEGAGEKSSRWRWLASVILAMLRPWSPRHFLATCWAMRPLTAVATILLVAGPWYLWVGLRTDGEFLRGFFFEHNMARAMQSFEGHQGGPWFYPVILLVGFFPWSILAIPVGLDVYRRLRAGDPTVSTSQAKTDVRTRAAIVLAVCWMGVWIGVFSLARTKLPSYITPCYPAVALLVGMFVARWSAREVSVRPIWAWSGLAVLATVGVALVIALPLLATRFMPGDEWLGAVGLVPLTGAGLALLAQRQRQPRWTARAIAGTAVAFLTTLFGLVSLQVDRHQHSQVLLDAVAARGGTPRVGALGGLEPSWVVYGRRPIVELVRAEAETSTTATGAMPKTTPGTETGLAPTTSRETTPAAATVTSKPVWRRPFEPVDRFLESGPDRYVITTDRELAALQERYADRLTVIADAPRFLKKGRLLLVTLDAASAERVSHSTPPPASARR